MTLYQFFSQFFSLSENRTNVRTELLAGLTTFLTMAYIIFVQPAVLSKDFAGNPTGLDFGAVLLATCVGSALGSILMGLYAKYPIALAPGMGENFFFVSVVMSLTALGVTEAWRVTLAIVFLSGIIFLILSIFRLREAIIDTVSPSMANGIAVGIGFFIAFIGLRNGGLIVGKPGTLVGLTSEMVAPDRAVFFLGLLVTAVLHVRRVRGSILWGILSATLLAILLGQVKVPGQIFGWPEIRQSALFQLDLKGALTLTCLPFIAVFLFMVMFDTVGTLIGVAEQAGFMKKGKLPRANRALMVDAAATTAGACLGTSTITCFIESATGVEYGGRTGLTSITTGVLFLLALFLSPIVGMVAHYPPITAPALVLVGAMMIQNVRKIDWPAYDESIPAFLVMIGVPLTYSIADGLALGFVSYPVIKLLSGKAKEVKWLIIVLAAVLMAYFIFVRSKLG